MFVGLNVCSFCNTTWKFVNHFYPISLFLFYSLPLLIYRKFTLLGEQLFLVTLRMECGGILVHSKLCQSQINGATVVMCVVL